MIFYVAMTSGKAQNAKAGVFIDGANLFWACKDLEECGKERWAIDFFKLKDYLKKKYSPVFYKFYDCVDENPSSELFKQRALGSSKFHKRLGGYGYDVQLKPLKYIRDKKTGAINTKGDMDTTISLDIKNALNDIENVVLFSGDSDFLPVVTDAHAAGKHIRIFSFEHTLSWELKEFSIKNARCNYKILDKLRGEIEFTSKVWKSPATS